MLRTSVYGPKYFDPSFLGRRVEKNPREGLVLHANEGVGLVIAQQNVVARFETLDQIVFKQQGLHFRICDNHFNVAHFGNHDPQTTIQISTGMKVGADPRLQVLCFADIQHFASLVLVLVDTGAGRNAGKSFC